jgi:hypothetical protein
VQASDRAASHAVQLTPSTPHAIEVGCVHVVPEQQPFGQEAALHTQEPPMHAWPVAQGAPLPHRHWPCAEHPSDVFGSQAVHAPPPVPHAASDLALHVGPEQQPEVHVDAQPAQVPLRHGCAEGQGVHALPPLPHAVALLPGWQAFPAQHPVGQERESQTQVPFRHRCPATHSACLPHTHPPVEEHPSDARGSHVPHVAPGAAQLFGVNGVHRSPLQHPDGHDVASQTQTPCEQCSPGLQGGPEPHRHSPVAEHASAVEESHATHVAPPEPHVVTERSLHVAPLQQPLGHDCPSHTHRPPAHRCPLLHAGPAPQAHSPDAEHPSAKDAVQATHALPPAPQDATDGVSQVMPEQHPDGHAQLVQTPAVHESSGGQREHACPELPQDVGSFPAGLHVVPSQHPVAQEVASQTHCPAEHLWPAWQAGPDPQWQALAESHPSLTVGSHCTQTQAPLTHCRPGGHCAPPAHAGPSCR